MDKFITPAYLPDNSVGKETGYYQLMLTPEELDEKKNQLVKISVEIQMKEEAEAERRKEFKAEINPIKDERKEVLEECRTKQKTVHGTLYFVHDESEGRVGTYAETGELLSERPMLPGERQLRIGFQKTGTNE